MEHDTLSTIDLAKRDDVNLLCRALRGGWTIADHVRTQVREQLPAALAPAAQHSEDQLKKLRTLAAAVGMEHLIEGGAAAPSNRSNRNPNRRQLRQLGRQRAREALHARDIEAKGI